MPRLGVLGTLVWDTIHGRDPGRSAPVEEWGGISYALSAFEAAGPEGWEAFPILKVGRDVRGPALDLLRSLERAPSREGVRFVPEPNNRVEIRYRDREHRTERLSGGVPGWEWEEVAPLARSCDAMYVNFIAGWELDLPVASRVREAVDGPVYGDLHSLFLGIGPDGIRRPRKLERWPEWTRCFHLVQLNERELRSVADERGDPWRAAAEAVGEQTRALLVTLGTRGAAWVAAPGFDGLADRAPGSGPARSGRVPAEEEVLEADPTGCGDVWGITCFGALLDGAPLEEAIRRANRLAAKNARYRGGTALARLGGSANVLRAGDG